MKYLLLTFIFCFIIFMSPCQDKIVSKDVTAFFGAGFPETYHAGLKFNWQNWHYQVSYGTRFRDMYTLNFNTAYHFGGHSKFTHQKPWYVSIGGSFIQRNTPQVLEKNFYLNSRVGRQMNVNKWLSITLSGGLGFLIHHHKYNKVPSSNGWNFDIWVPVIPSGQFSLNFILFRRMGKNGLNSP